VAGRALAFSDPDIINLVRDEFIPVTGDDWYQRRRDDDEGRFFRHVADQGPRQGEGGATRQGIYVFTASGQLLAYKNAGQNPDVMRQVFRGALAAWKNLPEPERRPGGFVVKDFGTADPKYNTVPPPDTAIIQVFTRALERKADGSFSPLPARCETQPHPNSAQRDQMWLRADEVRQLVPLDPKVGQTHTMPAGVARRMARFHLLDSTRGEASFWDKQHVRIVELKLIVTAVSDTHIDLRLHGPVLVATEADVAKAERGFDVQVRGVVQVERKNGKLTRFDVVALGEHWGECRFTPGARPGRSPVGIAFRVRTPPDTGNQIPPQGLKSGSYWNADR